MSLKTPVPISVNFRITKAINNNYRTLPIRQRFCLHIQLHNAERRTREPGPPFPAWNRNCGLVEDHMWSLGLISDQFDLMERQFSF